MIVFFNPVGYYSRMAIDFAKLPARTPSQD